MIDRETQPDKLKHLFYAHQAIKLGRPVKQEDFKAVISYANELSVDPRFNLTDLAVDIGYRHFWTSGTIRQISLAPDEELARELTKLKEHALTRLNTELQDIPTINCHHAPRSENDIQADEVFIYDKIARVTESLGELITQTTPKTS